MNSITSFHSTPSFTAPHTRGEQQRPAENHTSPVSSAVELSAPQKAPFHFLELYGRHLKSRAYFQSPCYSSFEEDNLSAEDSEKLKKAIESQNKQELDVWLPKLKQKSSMAVESPARSISLLMFHGETPFLIKVAERAIEINYTALLAFLLKNGVNVDSVVLKNGYANSLLSIAIREDTHIDCIRLLLAHAKNRENLVNSPHSSGFPLNNAFFYGRGDIVKELLKAGASLSRSSSDYDSEEKMFIGEACDGRLSMIKLLHKAGFPLNFQEENTKRTALHYAAASRHNQVVEYLLKNGIDASLADSEGHDYLAFSQKAFNEIQEEAIPQIKKIFYGGLVHNTLEFYINQLVDINIPIDKDQNTVLHLIAKDECSESNKRHIKDLLAKNANPDLVNKQGETARDYLRKTYPTYNFF